MKLFSHKDVYNFYFETTYFDRLSQMKFNKD